MRMRAAAWAAPLLFLLGAPALLVAAPATAEPTEASEAPPAAPSGRDLYVQHCAICHGPEGKGDGPAGLPIVPMPRDFSVGRFKFDADSDGRTGTDRDLFLVIRDGAGAYGGNPVMAPWAHLGEERIRELVAYVRSLERHPEP